MRPVLMAMLALLMLLHGPVAAGGARVLRVLAWPGYADAEVIQEFERASGARVELTLVDSDETLWKKLGSGAADGHDVFAVNTAELQRYIDAGRVQPVDPARIPNIRRQLPRFRDSGAIPGLVRQVDGHPRLFGVPYTYAEMGLIYDRRQIPEPPASLQALWDPRYRGKVIAYNGGTHSFSLAAQALGNPSPFHLDPAQWPAAVERLIALRRNVLAFYTQPEESVQLFLRHGAALMFANYGLQQLQLLRAAGADVGYTIPREGALAWLDCWALSREAREPELAHAWINHLLGPTASRLLVSRQGLANTVAEPAAGQAGDRRLWLEPVEDVALRERLWGRIHSGDRATRVLAP